MFDHICNCHLAYSEKNCISFRGLLRSLQSPLDKRYSTLENIYFFFFSMYFISFLLGINVLPPPMVATLPPKVDLPKDETKVENVEKETFTLEDVIKSLDDSLVKAESDSKIDSKKAGDIRKRIKMFEDKWIKEQLNEKLKSGMFNLSQHLKNEEIQEAEKLQQKLNLDHPSQCTPWMIAIRQLILALKQE